MRVLRGVLLVPLLLALLAGGASARAASRRPGLDPSFGHGGVAKTTVQKRDQPIKAFTVATDGRVYVLDSRQLLAFRSDGKIARGFGEDGRVTVRPTVGKGGPIGMAVDSRGRLLIAGSTSLRSRKAAEAYVIRLRPDGSRDASFGEGGEVTTDLGLPTAGAEAPSLEVTSIFVDAQDRPVIGGSFGAGSERRCGYTFESGPAPFVGRLSASGAIDASFAGSGTAVLKGPGGVSSLAEIPGGGIAAFTTPCSTPPRFEWQAPVFSAFTESGEANPLATERPLAFSYTAPAIDPDGRIVELESPPPAGEGASALRRLLPNGERDPSFGNKGRVVLIHGLRPDGAFAVDAQGRPIIATETGKVELRRFLPDGRLDTAFGPRGRLVAAGEEPSAIALDGSGRIYTVTLTRGSPKRIVEVDRFIPGS